MGEWMLVLSHVFRYQRDSSPFSYRPFLLFTLILLSFGNMKWMNALTPGICCHPKAVSSLGKVGNPSLSMNNTLLVEIDLVLVREYLFSVPETFRDVQ